MLMKEFSPDTVPNLYKESQHAVCKYFGLVPTPTIHIASGSKPDWDFFHRDSSYNRINIRKPVFDYYKSKFYNIVEERLNG
jgi:hypothetical protein